MHPEHPILVVDDDEQDLTALSISLVSAGFNNLRTCLDGREALGMLVRDTFSLVLLDLNMPVVSGHEIIRQTAALESRPPIVIITGSSRIEDFAEGAAGGVMDYLVKPIDREQLIAVVKRALAFPSHPQMGRLTRDYLLSDRITAGAGAAGPPSSGGIFAMLDQVRTEYRRLIGSLPIPYVLLEQDGYRVRYCNDAFLRFLGSPPPPGQPAFLEMLNSESRERTIRALREKGELHGEELEGRTPDGRGFVIVGSFRQSASDGSVEGGFVDVTAHKKLQQQLAKSSRLETVGRLAAGLAHDFANTLLVVSGFAEMIACEEGASHLMQSYTGEIRKAVAKAETMIRRLLSMGKTTRSAHSSVDLHAVLREAESSFRQHLRAHQSLTLSLEAADPLVDIPADQIDEVVRNLVLNARDAMPEGGAITVTTRTGESPAASLPPPVFLEIKDTGIGMDAETRQRIFEPYFTTKLEGAGSGLGLSMVQLVIDAVGGSIEVESEPGGGALFRIKLPPAAATEAHGGERPPEERRPVTCSGT